MRTLGISILICFIIFGCAKNPTKIKGNYAIFKTTTYIMGEINAEKLDTLIIFNIKLNPYFYKEHFNIPYYLPETFYNKNNESDSLIIWENENSPKNLEKNIYNTEIFDKEGKLISFASSGCNICSYFPYKYKVEYDNQHNLSRIYNVKNNFDSFDFSFDKNDNLFYVVKSYNNIIEKSVRLVNTIKIK